MELFKTGYRNDDIRGEDTITIAGRRVHRVRIDLPPQKGSIQTGDATISFVSTRAVALFDARTLRPLEFVLTNAVEVNGHPARYVMSFRYTTFETLPRTPANLAKLRISHG